eukprot:Gb_36727 [translate_table: standard]
MSQQQVVQNRPPTGIGFGRRRADRDIGNHSDNKLAPARSSFGVSGNMGVGCGSYNHMSSENFGSTNNNRLTGEGPVSGSRGGGPDKSMHDRLLFTTMCLIGQTVEVQVKNGSIYSGIFHTACAEKDYGVVLKMARLTKDGSIRGGKSDPVKDAARKAPIRTLIILSKDLVQVTAKDILLTGDVPANGRARENRHDIVTDSFLSQTCHIEVERELKPWTPDNDAPQSVGLENTFQNTWNRNWDQFETNKALFGVESTFDEELYTTKLERGPEMRELERKALETAREIEGQATDNFHLAEERGRHVKELLDEERRFSSIPREEDEDIGEDNEDLYIDSQNEETFGSDFVHPGCSPYISSDNGRTMPVVGESEKEISQACHEVEGSTSNDSSVKNDIGRQVDELNLQEKATGSKLHHEVNDLSCSDESLKDKAKELELRPSNVPSGGRKLSSVDAGSGLVPKAEKSGRTSRGSTVMLMSTSPASAPPASALPIPVALSGALSQSSIPACLETSLPAGSINSGLLPITSGKDSLVIQPVPPQVQVSLPSRTGSTGSSVVEFPSSSCSIASPSSSVGSSSSKKSTLNPNAKEFRLNPNAKNFSSFTGLRPTSPVVQGPVYMPGSIPPLVPIHSMPVGMDMSSLMHQSAQPVKFAQYNNAMTATGVSGAPYPQNVGTFVPATALPAQPAFRYPSSGQQQIMGHSYSGQQPVRYSSQASPVQPAPAYMQPSGQLYSQQMMFGQPGQVVYVQPYLQEMMQGMPVPPPQGSIPHQSASQQAQQPKHRDN